MDLYAQNDGKASLDDASNWIASKFLDQVSNGQDTVPPFSFTYGGKPSGDLLKTWAVKRDSSKLDDNRTQLTTTYTDLATGLELRCVGVQYHDFPTVEWTLYFKNTGPKDTPILEKIQALDTTMPSGEANIPLLHYFNGGFAGPNAYQPLQLALAGDTGECHLAPGGRGSDRYLPYFNYEYGAGGVIFAIGWPGQWSLEITNAQNWKRHVQAGMELTHFVLHPGEEVRSPMIALQFWQGGDWIDAQNVWRRWMIAHSTPNDNGKPLTPQIAGCSSHLFGEMIHANEENQKLFADTYTEKGFKLDYWWMDAGWYFNDGHWDDTGTWEVDTKRFPNGLKAITDNLHAKGMKSIVWFEPERVRPGTWLATNHPDWLLGPADGVGNKLLSLGNPEAWKWLVEHVDGLIISQGIDLYRQDYNINPLGFWRANDAPDRQGITEIKYITGYLAYWDELLKRHPSMLIDTCASGGRRNDLETLRRAVPLLRSDDIGHPVDNQGMTYGYSFWEPYQGTGGAVKSYDFRSMCLWHLTVGPDARDKTIDYEPMKLLLKQWRETAPNVLGDYYPLLPYTLSENAWMAWQYNRPEAGVGMVQLFRRANVDADSTRVHLRGLQPGASYELTDIDTASKQTLTGKQLMDEGLALTVAQKPAAVIITYQRK